jgi:hypothetical protein
VTPMLPTMGAFFLAETPLVSRIQAVMVGSTKRNGFLSGMLDVAVSYRWL